MKDKQAFPHPQESPRLKGEDFIPASFGLTRRELFAAMAMQGLAANTEYPYSLGPNLEGVKDCVAYADALIAELEKAK